MRVPVLACAALGAFASVADGAADYSGLPDWENPYVTSSNRLPARAVFVPASSLEEAVDIAYLRKPRTASKWVLSLDGEWNFEWQPWPEGYRRVEHVERVDEKKSGKIIVPGCWRLADFYDSFQGGYIWDFADQGLLDKDGRSNINPQPLYWE